ncbi:MAG TPA: ankyrin repeat domain-containing protein, partial [Vicinamibacteria bacterium]
MSDAQPLPPRPDLAQYRALAKDLRQAAASGDPAAIRLWARRWLDALARALGPDHQTTLDEREREADRIASRWKKRRAKHDAGAPCRLAHAQFFVAREHGFPSWPKFVAHVEALGDGKTAVAAFEAGVDAIVRGDLARLEALLRDHPGLVHQRSTRDHRSTLLHYVSANGVEGFRQRSPASIVQIANLLLDAGADVDAESEAYGGGSTTLGLTATSIHPQLAGVQIPLLETLIGRGARIDRPGLAGNRHSAVWGCLANGQPEAAAFFADHGARLSFEEAAGLGRLDALASFFDDSGALAPSVTAEQRSSALRYGAGFGHTDVVRLLLEKGVEATAADRDGQTALHWATFG